MHGSYTSPIYGSKRESIHESTDSKRISFGSVEVYDSRRSRGRNSLTESARRQSIPISLFDSANDKRILYAIDINDGIPEGVEHGEPADKLRFDVSSNIWISSPTNIRVAKRLFANGNVFKCFRFKDETEPNGLKVMKKPNKSMDGRYDLESSVRVQTLARIYAMEFSGFSGQESFQGLDPASSTPRPESIPGHDSTPRPESTPLTASMSGHNSLLAISFLETSIYELKARSNQPRVRAEPFMKIYEKLSIFLMPVGMTAAAEDMVDSHVFAAFQFFTYKEKRLVFVSATRVGRGLYTRPQVTSGTC